MTIQTVLEIACTATMGIMAGIYLIFSTTIMPSLRQLENGAFVMAKINDVILNPTFKFLFFFSGISSAYFGVFANQIDVAYRLGCLLFFFGTFFVTLLKNVPLNNRLKHATQTQEQIYEQWDRYFTEWGNWNHVRSACAVLAMLIVCFSNLR